MPSFFSYIAARLREPSTMAGMALVATGVATALQAGGTKAAFIAAGLQIVGGAAAAFKSDPVTTALTILPPSVASEAVALAPAAVKVSDQVASLVAEFSAVAKSVQGVAVPAAPVAAQAAP